MLAMIHNWHPNMIVRHQRSSHNLPMLSTLFRKTIFALKPCLDLPAREHPATGRGPPADINSREAQNRGGCSTWTLISS